MLHLNRKGFAISTVLYGILSIMILLLISILAFLKSTKSLNTNFSSDIEQKLNNCVTDEIIIENCYASGSTTCDHTAYYSCIGIMDETHNPGNDYPTIKDKLVPLVVTGNTEGIQADSGEQGRYIYRGENVNNYIRYDNKTWRIVSLESDGSTKIMLTGYSNPLPWDEEDATDWKNSTLKNFLDNTFYNTIADKSKLVRRIWSVGTIYDTGTVTQIKVAENINEVQYVGSSGTDGTVGLISGVDYLKATLNDCSNNALKNTTCLSWITANTTWIINGYKDIEDITQIRAGIIDSTTKEMKGQAVTTSISFSPVVYLDRKVRIAAGDGTLGSPYILD